MASIQSDMDEVHIPLERILNILQGAGCYIHRDLQVKVNDQGMQLGFPGDAAKPVEILKLTKECLIPISRLDCYIDKGSFYFREKAGGGLSAMQIELAENIFRLYNLTRTAEFYEKTNFWLGLEKQSQLIEKVLEARSEKPSFRENLNQVRRGLQGSDRNRFMLDGFFKSRVLDYQQEPSMPMEQFIMPLADYFNHHWQGSRFFDRTKTGEANGSAVQIRAKKPVPGTDECFTCYSPMDSLDSFIKYGFVDRESPVVRSIPLSLDLEQLGTFALRSNMGRAKGKTMGKIQPALRKYAPNIAVARGSGTGVGTDRARVMLSHLFIPDHKVPYSMRRFIATSLRQLSADTLKQEELISRVKGIEQIIVEKNRGFYQELSGLLKQCAETGDGQRALDAVCQNQLTKIENYRRLIEKLDRDSAKQN